MHLFCQISNALGIFPVIYCIQYRAYGLAGVLALAFSLSVIYHINEDNKLALLADTVGVSLLVAAGATVLRRSEYILTVSNLMTILYASAGLTCFLLAGDDTQSADYKVYHTAWHVFSMYAIATFLYSYFNSSNERDESRSKILCKNVKHLVVRVRRGEKVTDTSRSVILRKGLHQSPVEVL